MNYSKSDAESAVTCANEKLDEAHEMERDWGYSAGSLYMLHAIFWMLVAIYRRMP